MAEKPTDDGGAPRSEVAAPEPAPTAEPESELSVEPGPYAPGEPVLVVEQRLRTGSLPKSVEVSPDGAHVWVANFGWKDRSNVWRWRTHDLERDGEIVFPGNAVESLFSAGGSTVFVSSFSGGRIYEADADSLRVRRRFRVDANPKVMALSADERLLYVSNWSSHTVSVVDLDAGKTLDHLRVGGHPRGMVVADDGTVFVSAMYRHRIHVLTLADDDGEPALEQVRVMPVCQFPRHSLWAPNQAALIVSCSGEDRLVWYDPTTGDERDTAAVGDNPRTIAASRDGRYIAVANFDGGSVSLVDTHQRTVHTTMVPKADHIVGVAVDWPRVYATNWLGNELLVLEPGP